MPEKITPRDLLQILWRHKKKALACSLLVIAATVVATALMQPRFRSEAMLFVRLGRENVALDPTASMGSGSVVAVPQAREDEINSVVEILKSRTLSEKIVDKIGPRIILGEDIASSRTDADAPVQSVVPGDAQSLSWLPKELAPVEPYIKRLAPGQPLSPRDEALERFAERLNVWAPKRSTVVFISFDGPSPEVAQAVVTQLIERYLEEHVRLNRTAGSHDFFVDQTQEIRQRLNATETQMRDLKNRTGMASVDEQRTILVDRAGRLEDELLQNGTELASLEAELASLNEKLDRLPETRVSQRVSGLPNQAADLMRQQLYSLQLKEQELLTTYKEETRQVKEIRRQIVEAQGILAKEEYDRTQSTNSSDPTFQQLHLALHTKQTIVASLRARLEKSREQLAQTRTALEQLNDYEMQIAQLRRDVELQETNYRKYAENLEEARIDQALKLERISNIGIAQSASLQPKPVSPRKKLQFGLGLLVALLSGVGVALAAEYLGRPLKASEGESRQLEFAGLATVPEEVVQIVRVRESHDPVMEGAV
jgi:uncharacterized protein involved in exopolysaccharide biosynthesis